MALQYPWFITLANSLCSYMRTCFRQMTSDSYIFLAKKIEAIYSGVQTFDHNENLGFLNIQYLTIKCKPIFDIDHIISCNKK